MQKLITNIQQNKIYFCIFWTVIFFILTSLGIFNHAMWRDELNGWLIARDTHSWTDFVDAVKYEGHPFIWYLCLLVLNKISSEPILMKILHLFLSTTSIFIFLRFSPFRKLEKVLFIFGYLPLYEYSLISRNYIIGILFLFIFLSIYSLRQKSYLMLAILLALLANTNAYCLLISLALGATLALEALTKDNKKWSDLGLSLVVFFLGISISIWTLIPPGDSNLQGGGSQWFLQFDLYRLAQSISRIWNAYMMIIVPSDSKFLDVTGFSLLSLGLFTFMVLLLIKKPFALFFYILASLQIVFFTYVKFLGSPRHYGTLYIILITALWLAEYYPEQGYFKQRLPYRRSFILTILIGHVLAGTVAYIRDISLPFSASREAANYLKSQSLNKLILVGSEDFAISPISGYLQEKIYYPESKKYGSYVLFNAQRKVVDLAEIFKQIEELLKTNQKDILLILNQEMKQPLPQNSLKIQPVKEFTHSFISNEQYYLYLIKNENKP